MIRYLRLSSLLLLLVACGDDDMTMREDMSVPMTGCGDLDDGESRCVSAETLVSCVGTNRIERSCRVGETCVARAGGTPLCECDDVMDSVCPAGCASDPDCVGCEPTCGMNDCGDNGCGGECGTCADGMFCDTGFCTATTGLCSDTCGPAGNPGAWAGDGECDDGGAGAMFSGCEFGTDCTDCGSRDPADIDAGSPGMDAGSDASRPDSGSRLDAGPPIPDACVPSCDGLVCGTDGCGGSCGTCAGDERCNAGACERDCFLSRVSYQVRADAAGDWANTNSCSVRFTHTDASGDERMSTELLRNVGDSETSSFANSCDYDVSIIVRCSMRGGVMCETTQTRAGIPGLDFPEPMVLTVAPQFEAGSTDFCFVVMRTER